MELRRAAIAVIRSSASISPLAEPLQCSRQSIIRAQLGRRCISSTSQRSAFNPEPTTRAPSSENPESRDDVPASQANAPSTRAPPKEDTLESLTSTLNWIKPGGRSAPSRFSSPSAQVENREAHGGPNMSRSTTSSSSAVLGALSNATRRPEQPLSAANIWSAMKTPASSPRASAGAERGAALMKNVASDMARAPMPVQQPLRLTPSTGRSFDIGPNMDLSRGVRMLEISCAQNKVRHDLNRQRFHERPGLKRKRLARERWRKKFMEGFQGVVGRVKQLKNQGW
ncbi:ribosomal s21 protein [Rutstroemia sp. NJR-2017a BVV2]|nr:ribosomal s21 protein [Rutstroemia sp. NJR-2017a BVV2]